MRLIVVFLVVAGTVGLVSPSGTWSLPIPSVRAIATVVLTAAVTVIVGAPLIVAGAASVVGVGIPEVGLRVRRRRRARAATALWPDFLAVVRSRIGAGDPLPSAVRTAASALGEPFVSLDLAWGGSFATELDRARDQWADPVADRVLMTLRVAAQTGGAHVDAVLAALSNSLADEMQVRAAHEAAITQQRLTAGVALVAPWLILMLSFATNPTTGEAFSTPTGHVILTGGLIATVVGYVLARRVSSLSEPPRVFE